MKREVLNLTEEDGYDALRGHVVERAMLGRERYGPTIDEGALLRLIQDREVIRFPVHLGYDDGQLLDGEFAWAKALGERPLDGYQIIVASMFQDRPDDLVAIVAYHLVRVNYLDVATHVEAELFGATLLGLKVDDYYAHLCKLADELPRPAMREVLDFDSEEGLAAFPVSSGCGSGSESGDCGCGPSAGTGAGTDAGTDAAAGAGAGAGPNALQELGILQGSGVGQGFSAAHAGAGCGSSPGPTPRAVPSTGGCGSCGCGS